MTSSSGTPAIAAPVLQSQRINLIDSLRGFVILGILLMNMPGFSMPGAVAGDPSLLNEYGTINYKVWLGVEWIPEGTQRAIFSMLFGAGIILFSTRLEQRMQGVVPADYFVRRQLWLLVFGLVNIYVLLWPGDILFDYGCCGFIMFAFRKIPVRGLFIGAFVCMLLMIARENRELYLDKTMITKGEKVAALDTSRAKLTEKQKEELDAFTGFKESVTKEAKIKRMNKAIRHSTGSYEDVYKERTGNYLNYALVNYGYLGIWDILLFMFLGMAFFRTGVLTGTAKLWTYLLMAIIGLGAGLALSWYRIHLSVSANFDWYKILKTARFDWYTVSRVLRALGILGTLMLLYRSGWFRWLFSLMRPVGQMAFTNYLTQSLICAIIFYGPGFGYYGQLQRYQVYEIVVAIWVVQIIWSHLWLRYFNFGPLEWCWRSLTYWKLQPMKKPVTD